MDVPLLIPPMLERAEQFFPKKEVVSKTSSGLGRFTYQNIGRRARALASALERFGLKTGERVATFAWNNHRHLEAYFAVPGAGFVLHMLNIRLSQDHLRYIIQHAEDRVLLIDEDLLPLIEPLKDELPSVKAFIIMCDHDQLPKTDLHPVYHYESLIAEGNEHYSFRKDLAEDAPAAMCYTSATTGKPKGVVYSHRGIVLHSMALGLVDSAGICERDVCMPVVPMFHANAWGQPYAATWFGAKQVLPGNDLSPKALARLIDSEKVTMTAGVPTVWLGLLNELEKNEYDTSHLRAIMCGGSAAPKGMIRKFEQKFKIPFIHGYGLTETTPVVTLSQIKKHQESLSDEEKLEIRAKQGNLLPCLEMKVVNENGEVPWNGKEMGELLVRGPWVANEYYRDERSQEAFRDGWFYTGDVVTVDEEGTIKIVDRTKDLIKSGGEWISSVDLENALMAHEAVFEAAVISVPHPKWQERPLACVVLHEGYEDKVEKEELLAFLRPQFARWWLPDDIVFLQEIPKTSVGKFQKRTLREKWKNHLLHS